MASGSGGDFADSIPPASSSSPPPTPPSSQSGSPPPPQPGNPELWVGEAGKLPSQLAGPGTGPGLGEATRSGKRCSEPERREPGLPPPPTGTEAGKNSHTSEAAHSPSALAGVWAPVRGFLLARVHKRSLVESFGFQDQEKLLSATSPFPPAASALPIPSASPPTRVRGLPPPTCGPPIPQRPARGLSFSSHPASSPTTPKPAVTLHPVPSWGEEQPPLRAACPPGPQPLLETSPRSQPGQLRALYPGEERIPGNLMAAGGRTVVEGGTTRAPFRPCRRGLEGGATWRESQPPGKKAGRFRCDSEPSPPRSPHLRVLSRFLWWKAGPQGATGSPRPWRTRCGQYRVGAGDPFAEPGALPTPSPGPPGSAGLPSPPVRPGRGTQAERRPVGAEGGRPAFPPSAPTARPQRPEASVISVPSATPPSGLFPERMRHRRAKAGKPAPDSQVLPPGPARSASLPR
ncbi:uncharacterized protein [Delphinus delphis]|uniref:uncharacterized protein n=1 Tax=Delphinus delphis TaxID=9728 RepID=UPI00375015DA